MASHGQAALRKKGFSYVVALSYAVDWFFVVGMALVSYGLGKIEPNKRPFSLADPNISFPFTEHEACPPWLLLTLNSLTPIAVILVVTLIFVPGATVPKDTPASLIWKRKLWELHVGLLGLALSLSSAWFFTNGMKNMYGKPRPDMLSRCEPDIANARQYRIGGYPDEATFAPLGQLYSADICKQSDRAKLDDGFRSYPSGHSSSAAAGLIYLSLFLASKFGVVFPFVVADRRSADEANSHVAFPSRIVSTSESWESARQGGASDDRSIHSTHTTSKLNPRGAQHNARLQSLRLQAAAPPVYLLLLSIVPFCTSIWIASSRWYNFRHHGFDILFGYLMGVVTAIFSFRFYHLSISSGAGWAWGPRSRDRAFWAGVGRLGYAADNNAYSEVVPTHERAVSNDSAQIHNYPPETHSLTQRNPVSYSNTAYSNGPYQDVELQRVGNAA